MMKCVWNSLLIYHTTLQRLIMSMMASQITSLTIVYSTVYTGADQGKHQSSVSLAFVWGIHWWPVNSPHKGQWHRKCFHLMTSSWEKYGNLFISTNNRFYRLTLIYVVSLPIPSPHRIWSNYKSNVKFPMLKAFSWPSNFYPMWRIYVSRWSICLIL